MSSNANRYSPLHRRDFLATGGALAGTLILGACDMLRTSPESGGDTGSGNGSENGPEAPSLAQRVDSGDLPAVEERLPDEPLVVEPNERIGVYGGQWNTLLEGSPEGDFGWIPTTVNHEGLTRWDPQFTELIPNVAQEYELSDDGTEVTLMLRPGMRWSDGEQFTADDLLFAYNDVALNTDLYPAPPSFAVSGDEPATLEKLDDHTVRFTFSAPNGLFLQFLATPEAFALVERPRHYLEQFHKPSNPEADQLADDEGYPDWVELFFAKAELAENPKVPRLHPWVPRNAVSEQRVVFDRNPYYWKVDPQRSQLPYLDRVVFAHASDHEVSVLKAGNGELEFETRRFFDDLRNKPVLAESREPGDYHFVDVTSLYTAASALYLNLTHKDPVKREVFQNKDFRIGVSHAIDRQTIIDAVYQGQGKPCQVAPRSNSPWYDEEMATQYTEYDPDAANSYLDRAGYTQRNDDGIRLGPDGAPIAFTIEVETGRNQRIDSAELVAEQLSEVGLDVRVKPEGRSLSYERREGNEHDAFSRPAEGGGGMLPPLRPDFWFPYGAESYTFAPLWADWYVSGGDGGEEPPEQVRTQMEIYRHQVRAATDEDERLETMRELLLISKEYFFHIGICSYPDGYGIVKNTFHNVPSTFPQGWLFPSPGPTNPEQYFSTAGR